MLNHLGRAPLRRVGRRIGVTTAAFAQPRLREGCNHRVLVPASLVAPLLVLPDNPRDAPPVGVLLGIWEAVLAAYETGEVEDGQ